VRRCGCIRRRILRPCVGRWCDLEMISLVAHPHLQIAPGVASAIPEHHRSKTQAMPRTGDLSVAEVLLIYQTAFVRAQRRPDFDLRFALASQQQLYRAARDTMHAAKRVIRQVDAHRAVERRQAHVMGQPVGIDEIGLVGGKVETALPQVSPAAADFDVGFPVLLSLQPQQTPRNRAVYQSTSIQTSSPFWEMRCTWCSIMMPSTVMLW